MMGLSERRLRVRATYIANLSMADKYPKGSDNRRRLDDEREALSEYLGLIKEPIDPTKTKGKII